MTSACATVPRYRILETTTGPFYICEIPDGQIRTGWCSLDAAALNNAKLSPTLREDLAKRLARFFKGHPEDFSDVPHPTGPPFQSACWRAARRIGPGETYTYAQLAQAAGRAGAARAAGQAMRRNPLPVIVPCHRVLASGGGLGGFAGTRGAGSSALGIKRSLLRMEGHQID